MSDPFKSEQSPTAPVPDPGPPPGQVVKKSGTQKAQDTARNAYHIARMVLLLALGFIVALFVIRNWEDVELDFVFGDVMLPLALVMLLFTTIGIVLGMLFYWFVFRKEART